jgi:hypothetical protein
MRKQRADIFDLHSNRLQTSSFPPESYQYEYSAPGNPTLAARVKDLLAAGDLDCTLDTSRGFDHGTFVPLMLAFPEASVPVVCVSLHHSLNAATHLAIGRALAPLRDEGVLIVVRNVDDACNESRAPLMLSGCTHLWVCFHFTGICVLWFMRSGIWHVVSQHERL